jgi:hypothetical protein
MSALAWLSRESDSVTQVEIANLSIADRMMVSKVLRTLENNLLAFNTDMLKLIEKNKNG